MDRATGLMDADLLEQAVTPHTKAIMPVHQGPWPSWPQEGPPDEAIMMKALQEKRWCYLRSGAHFCRDYEKQLGSDYGGAHVMLTNAGTTALHACLYAMDIGPGDEVLVTGESFIATMQSILNLFAPCRSSSTWIVPRA